MKLSSGLRTVLFLLFLTTLSIADSAKTYQKGTIKKADASGSLSCDLIDGTNGGAKGYQIGNCADFKGGQVVDYRVSGDKVYIHREDGKESKCPITAELSGNLEPAATNQDVKYEKGTIEGFEVRRDTHIGGGGGGVGGTPSSPVSAWTRHAKVYELHGTDLIYKVDYCGAFQAGQFAPGEVVEYRVNGDRLYIRHGSDKVYNCQLEGTRKPDNAPTGNSAASAVPPTAPTAAAAPSTAKLSITSAPDGADIEVDGNFSGNTPSDLEVPSGDHSITVKKSGYKDWERKMKVAAGSSVHLNAEMEKTAN